jgi:hypothetical protein
VQQASHMSTAPEEKKAVKQAKKKKAKKGGRDEGGADASYNAFHIKIVDAPHGPG